jgi:hypothetical protein
MRTKELMALADEYAQGDWAVDSTNRAALESAIEQLVAERDMKHGAWALQKIAREKAEALSDANRYWDYLIEALRDIDRLKEQLAVQQSSTPTTMWATILQKIAREKAEARVAQLEEILRDYQDNDKHYTERKP